MPSDAPASAGRRSRSLDPLPRRRPGPADPARVRPRPRAERAHRGGQRGVPQRHDGHAPGRLPVRRDPRAGGDARDRARRGRRRRAADDGRIGFEPALTVLVLTPELYLPLRNLAAQFHASADGSALAARMLDLVEDAAAGCAGGRVARRRPCDPIRFEGVSFRYPLREVDVLRELDFELEPGELVAVVGPSGGGKTTLRRSSCASRSRRAGGSRRRAGSRLARRHRLARAHGLRAAAPDDLPRDGRRQHPARRSGRWRRARAGGGGARRRRRLRLAAAGRLRDARGGGRSAALDRPAATPRARAGVRARCPARPPRRADRGPRPRERSARRRGARAAERRPHGAARCARRRALGPRRPRRAPRVRTALEPAVEAA